MATMNFIILAAACVCAYAFPMEPTVPMTRNTIFADERLKGEIFENLETYDLLEQARNVGNSSVYRLPTTTKPKHYKVLWTIDITNLAFSGTVDIQLHATQPNVNEIVIHASEMTISSTKLVLNNAEVAVTPVEEKDTQFYRVVLNQGTLQYSEANDILYTLSISFAAPLRTNMYGIYRSWFRNNPTATGVSWMAATQFQATAGRWAFPCYDEPSFKATFDVTIRRPTAFKSWFCTRLKETVPAITGYQDDVFHTTPVMSTYLLALIVAEYESKSYSENNLLKYEVIARPGAMSQNQGDYAFDVGMKLLDAMSDHTALDFYDMDTNLKMTQAAIPDFGAGAMENWGLLTYREAYLMYTEQHTSSYFKQVIAYILSHEIAHMWFGNLVTCDWWDVLWLNEGFARYYQYFLTDWVEEYMGLKTRFITEQVHASLLSDSANNAHPLSTTNIGNTASVSAMFSTITYNKGAAVIRMTEHLLGFETHREGLRNYLAEKAYGTALPIHLFQNLQNVSVIHGAINQYGSDFNVIDYYKSWTEQAGHPVLNVQVNHQTGEMRIYQRRFNINTGYASVTNNNNYIVPINFATASNIDFTNTKPTHIIKDAVTTINRGSTGDEWVIFNKQQTGFYRVNYDDYTWDLNIMALRGPARNQIHEYNRAQIVNDVLQFARSGLMNYTRAFNIISFLEFETEYTPWVAALTGFSWIRNRLAGTPYLAAFESQVQAWANTAITSLTYYPTPNESFMRSYLRYQLAPQLCLMGNEACRTAAYAQFRALVDNGAEVPVDSRNWVYCNGLRMGSAADFTFLWNRYINHNVYTEKILLLQVLGCTPHTASLTTFLNAIVQENYIIRPQDYTTAFNSAVTGNEGNTQIVFQYIQNNLQTVINAFGNAATPLSYISSRLRTVEEINAFQQWATANQAALGNQYQAVYNGAETSRQSIEWASDVQSDMNNYFQTGPKPLEYSTPVPVVVQPIVTVTPENILQPVTPDLPPRDSAVTTYVSLLVIMFAIFANILF